MLRSIRRYSTKSPFAKGGSKTQSYDYLRALRITPAETFTNVPLAQELDQELSAKFQEFQAALKAGEELERAKEVARQSDSKKNASVAENKADLSSLMGRIDSKNIRVGNDQSKIAAIYPLLQRTARDEEYTKQELFLRRQHRHDMLSKLGAEVKGVYDPLHIIKHPKSSIEATVTSLLATGAHLGHAVELGHVNNQPFIYGVRDGVAIIDLEQTITQLRRAARITEAVAKQNGLILFVGTRDGQKLALEAMSRRCGASYVHSKWIPGAITNFANIASNWTRYEVEDGESGTGFDDINQPTGKTFDSEVPGPNMRPDLVVILNPAENPALIRECVRACIPTVGVADTNFDPSKLSYPIAANDDSIRTTDLITGVLARAAEKGHKLRRFEQQQRHSAELVQMKQNLVEEAVDESVNEDPFSSREVKE
ncbi:37S ribosomal protein MRP4 [Yarrowia sp. C11]|nr:37S ribosomal protein MRP4 [Yarrowia sp. C11]KAG5364538.1 37S ribosomal protein MRP4 [Yarrowia sp. E02]